MTEKKFWFIVVMMLVNLAAWIAYTSIITQNSLPAYEARVAKKLGEGDIKKGILKALRQAGEQTPAGKK